MGTAVVSVILFIVVSLAVKSVCKKYINAKKTGGCTCGCSGCSSCCNQDVRKE